MLRITGVVVCGARALRSGVREAYIYRLTEEGCPRGARFGDPGCVKKTVRSLDRPVAGASDYTAALARVILPADAEGISALEAARPGAIFEIAGQRDASGPGRGVGEEVEFGDAVVTPLPGPARNNSAGITCAPPAPVWRGAATLRRRRARAPRRNS